MKLTSLFDQLQVHLPEPGDTPLNSCSPIDGSQLHAMPPTSMAHVGTTASNARDAFNTWRHIPAPVRGELVRRFGEKLRLHKSELAQLITLECGKIISEGEGEVQEMIDICDFAVGLSRQLYGLSIASERPGHALREIWQPYGPTLIITAFNFPMAVWAWNASIALVCGNSLVWKPSEKASLCAWACQGLLEQVLREFESTPPHLSQLVIGEQELGEALVARSDFPLVSATGSCAMGRKVGSEVAARFGRSILELGGNNALIVSNTADLDMALRAIVFGAAGTAGQRCTTTRRLFIHDDVYETLMNRLRSVYPKLRVGDPRNSDTLVGPMIDQSAFEQMQNALELARADGSSIIGGKRVLSDQYPRAYYVEPALVEAGDPAGNHLSEVFAPVLYCFRYSDLDDAIRRQNAVDQGLSSALFTMDIREAEYFLSAQGSDCGIANINVGTSGAEIGGAFGGEKHTGGGRESGSDAWKSYMRRMTATVNYSSEMPLAQGVQFDI